MSVTFTIPELETERLRLRAPKPEDFETYAAFRASDRAALLGGPYARHQAWDQLAEIVGHWVLRGYGRWMVADKTTDEPLGIVGLFYPEGWPGPEIAWSVFDSAEGRGIAYEAAHASRAHAYEALGWQSVISCIDPKNTRSIALAKRMGCVEEEAFQHAEYGALHVWRHPGPATP